MLFDEQIYGGRGQPEFLLSKGLFLPKALLKKNWATRNLGRKQLVQQEETNRCVFLQFIFQTNLQKTKYNIHGKRQARLFTQESPVLFNTGRKWISTIRKSVTS